MRKYFLLVIFLFIVFIAQTQTDTTWHYKKCAVLLTYDDALNVHLDFLFHGVGGGHSLNVSLAAHSKLLHFLKQNEKDIWIAPMIEVADYIKEYRYN